MAVAGSSSGRGSGTGSSRQWQWHRAAVGGSRHPQPFGSKQGSQAPSSLLCSLGQKASEMASSSASTHQDGLEYTKAWHTNQKHWVPPSIQWNKYRSEVVETWRYTGQEQPTKLPQKKTTLTKKLCVKQTPGAATISMHLLKRHTKKTTQTVSKKRARQEATGRA